MVDAADDAELLSDMDAEGEEEMDVGYATPSGSADHDAADDADADGEAEDVGGNDLDAEGEDDEDAEGEDDDDATKAEYHGAVKLPDNDSLDSDREADDSDARDSAEDGSEDSSGSEAGNEWEAESVDVEEGEADIAARNNCIFCGQDEEHDPSEEFEEYLACAVCGDNSHRQCARNDGSLTDDIDVAAWRCPGCTQNDLAPDAAIDEDEAASTRANSIQRRLSTNSSRLTRDLLPQVRGGSKPGSHSIFNDLILEDDPADGSRSLRKRKASDEAPETVSRASSKRPKSSDEVEPRASPAPTESRARSATAASRSRRTPAAAADIGTPASQDTVAVQTIARPQRQRRPKREYSARVRIVSKAAKSLIIAIKTDLSKIKPPKRKRNGERDRNRNRRQSQATAARPRAAAQTVTPYTTPFYAFHEREDDEKNKKPYGGILTEVEAANERTFPDASDRQKFDKARRQAEEEWKERNAASEAEQEVKSRAAQKVAGPPSKIKCISFGGWEIDTWYAAPYPEEYSRNRVLYICEFCLKYMGSDYVAWRHKLKCPMKHPPGDEIYRDGSVSVFEVDGRKNPAYCQNLCLLAKLFLGSKTLYYDVEPFLFYIMTEYDELGCHFVGYFSKEKRPSSLNNVSCILTLPIHQRKGYGNLLIDFSYLLTRVEKKTGSPEKPLSDMGLVTYRKYWHLVLCYVLRDHDGPLSITDISEKTGMTADDIVAALEALRALVRDPVTKTYALRLDNAYFNETIEKWEEKGYVQLNPDALMWVPYVMGRSNLANYDRPALATIAPREGDEDDDVEPEEGVQQQQQLEKENKQLASAIDGMDTDTMDHEATVDAMGTPNPALSTSDPIDDLGSDSPSKAPTHAMLNGQTTATVEISQSPIPATRYELYPPVPGTVYRARRGGYRPKGSRITAHGVVFGPQPGLPPQRNRNRNRKSTASAKKQGRAGQGLDSKASPSLRKTRSGLGTPLVEPEDAADDRKESVEPGNMDNEVDEGDEMEGDGMEQDAEGEDEEYVEGEQDAEGEEEDDVEEEEEEEV